MKEERYECFYYHFNKFVMKQDMTTDESTVKARLFFCAPTDFVVSKWRNVFTAIVAIAVDQDHCMSKWGIVTVVSKLAS